MPVLHVGVVGSAKALGSDPGDILGGVFDVAGFTMHTILRIYLKARPFRFINDLVNTGRAISLSRLSIER